MTQTRCTNNRVGHNRVVVRGGSRWYWFVIFVARQIIIRALSGGLRIVGLENIPKSGGVIYAPNHVSMFDPPIVSCASRRAVTFMAKEELFRTVIIGPLIRSVGAFPVRRGPGDISAIKLAIKKLEEGNVLIMFPEGTRGDGETLGKIQSGVAMLAKRSGALVVPVGVSGSHKMLPKGAKLPRFSRLKVAFGEPFKYADTATAQTEKENRKLFADELSRRIVEQCRIAGLELRTWPESADPGSPDPGEKENGSSTPRQD